MEWLNLHTSTLDSPQFLGADPTQRATWLCLLRYSIGQENSGRVVGARLWADRKFQQLIRVTKREVLSACDLWSWEGDDIIILAYPVERENEVKRNRENGKLGGRPLKNNPNHNPEITTRLTDDITTRFCHAETEGEGEGEGERKYKEKDKEKGKESEETDAPASPTPLPFSSDAFRTAWQLFEKHRSEIKKPLKPTSASMSLKFLAGIGEPRAIRCIEYTIAKERRGEA